MQMSFLLSNIVPSNRNGVTAKFVTFEIFNGCIYLVFSAFRTIDGLYSSLLLEELSVFVFL